MRSLMCAPRTRERSFITRFADPLVTMPHFTVAEFPGCIRIVAVVSAAALVLTHSGHSVVIPAGPLEAVVNAQAAAAVTTIAFIHTIGMDNGTVRMLQFSYNTRNATTGVMQAKSLAVPLLAIVPIPYLRVRELTRMTIVAVSLRCCAGPSVCVLLHS